MYLLWFVVVVVTDVLAIVIVAVHNPTIVDLFIYSLFIPLVYLFILHLFLDLVEFMYFLLGCY